MKKGVVYQSEGKEFKEVYVGRILEIARPVGIWAKRVGWGSLVLTIICFAWIYSPLLMAEISYKHLDSNPPAGGQEFTEAPVYKEAKNPSIPLGDSQIKQSFEGYRIFIPKIGAESSVIANVNPFDKDEYSTALQKGVAEASGLSHPGESGTTYLFAHSVGNRIDFARYNAIFYLLDKLSHGDNIFINYRGDEYEYTVYKKEILRATDLRYLQPQWDEEILVLQTCYPPGTSWKRLVILAKRAYI